MSRAEVVEAVRRFAPKARKPSAGKGRGAGPAKLPTSRTFRLPGNFKIVIEGRRGIDRATIAGLLRDALAVVGDVLMAFGVEKRRLVVHGLELRRRLHVQLWPGERGS